MIKSLSKRLDYKTLNNYAYLNQASLGLISKNSVYSMKKFIDDIGQHGNAKMSDSDEIEFLVSLRDASSILLNCKPKNLAILSSASEILNQLPYLFEIQKHSKILLVESDFPSLCRPWVAYSKKKENKINIEYIKDKKNFDLTESIIKKIDKYTKFVIVSYVQFSTGSIIDILRLRKMTNEFGSRLIIDITQAAGALPINFKDWCCDALIASGYKWLEGHGGVAIAALSDEILNSMPINVGWMGARNPFKFSNKSFSLAYDARRFTQSTMSYSSIKSLEISINQLQELGIENIRKHTENLKEILIKYLYKTNWTLFHNQKLSFSSPNILCISKHKVNEKSIIKALRKNKVVCSYRNKRLRISLAHYNNENDIKKLISVIKDF